MRYISLEKMSSHPLGFIFDTVKQKIEIPLDFWKNKNIIYASDTENYFNPYETKIKKIGNFTNSIEKISEKYGTAKINILDKRDYWFLLKFFFIKSTYRNVNPETKGLANDISIPLIAGIPKGIKIKCECGNILDDKFFLRGNFKVPQGIPANIKKHDFYLRISNFCNECGKCYVIYRPKSTIYSALFPFLNFLFPQNNYDLKDNVGQVFHWMTILVDAIYLNKLAMYRLYYDDIIHYWNFVKNNQRVPDEIKEGMKTHYTIEDDLKVFEKIKHIPEEKQDNLFKLAKDFFKHRAKKHTLKIKLLTLNQFLARELILAMTETRKWLSGEKRFMGKQEELKNFMFLTEESIKLFNIMCLTLFCDAHPQNITIPLNIIIKNYALSSNPSLNFHKNFYDNFLEDLNNVLKQNNIEIIKTFDNTMEKLYKKYEYNKDFSYKVFFLWKTGAIISIIVEKMNLDNIQYKGDGLSLLDDIYISLGKWIYNDKQLSINEKINKLKNTLTIKQDPGYKGINKYISEIISQYRQEFAEL
jgi:hypothetical protein